MIDFVNLYLVPALAIGSVYALGAVGISMIFGILRFAHFAHGDLMTLGAYGVLGATALVAAKGETLHRTAGSVFFIAMIAMCVAAIPVAIIRYQPLNITAATFTLYLIATAWAAATRKGGETGAFERYAAVAGAAVAAGTLLYAVTLAKGAAPFMYGFGGIAAFDGHPAAEIERFKLT